MGVRLKIPIDAELNDHLMQIQSMGKLSDRFLIWLAEKFLFSISPDSNFADRITCKYAIVEQVMLDEEFPVNKEADCYIIFFGVTDSTGRAALYLAIEENHKVVTIWEKDIKYRQKILQSLIQSPS